VEVLQKKGKKKLREVYIRDGIPQVDGASESLALPPEEPLPATQEESPEFAFFDSLDDEITYMWSDFNRVESLMPYNAVIRHQNTCLFSTSPLK
jgi:hypothetical protein